MRFEENKFLEKFGQKVGYIFSYFLFTTVLFFIINLRDSNISYLIVMILTLTIVLMGVILKRKLK